MVDDNSQVLSLGDQLDVASALSVRCNELSISMAGDLRESDEPSNMTTSNWSSWLHYGEPLSVDDYPNLTQRPPELPPLVPIVISDHSAGPSGIDVESGGDTQLGLAVLLEELEQLAVQAKLLPIPRPPTLSLTDLCDILTLPMDISIPSIDTELAEAHIAYDSSHTARNAISAPARITVRDFDQPSAEAPQALSIRPVAFEDSGYASGPSSPAFSELSYHSDIERTPRSYHRPRAPSPLTPVTPDFASFPSALPAMHSSCREPEHTPVRTANPEQFSPCLPTTPHTLPKSHASALRSSSLDAARSAQPSKTRFLPIKSLILNRKRSLAAKDLHLPLPPTEPLPRVSLDAPRSATSASFLDFKIAKRGLRRRNSEALLSTKTPVVDTLQYESFLSFY
ncbi:uncharacterized protein PHACADRAFT_211014 [Phanerochaete carnosa HHB-10118-sp]|uniref:Uncharacterized protein n=1 Tax=Phanerochaete carnosa (strain HHB-10118-sp) TaxID=650164 RepID=K5W2K2_PHACS|nr:uncharacterized protein PHACADRAFT_211014 [Phanerochaete carnosa HHB-10118-sp]EKM53315.1 hypothetical protein PHACADRAFT_211014 [Phanerochaete carnosa HHB-10118-sp]